MGRTVFDIARESMGYGEEFVIKGFLDDNSKALDGFKDYPPVLGSIKNYEIQPKDVFTWSIGNIQTRKRCCESIISKGGKFITLIHKTVRLGTNVKVGQGSIIAAFASLGADAIVGDFVLIQAYSVVAHDVKVGNWARIDTHVVCVGGTVVEEEATVYTNSVLNHKVVVEKGAIVAACSFVIKKVQSGTTVYGNPAKRLV